MTIQELYDTLESLVASGMGDNKVIVVCDGDYGEIELNDVELENDEIYLYHKGIIN